MTNCLAMSGLEYSSWPDDPFRECIVEAALLACRDFAISFPGFVAIFVEQLSEIEYIYVLFFCLKLLNVRFWSVEWFGACLKLTLVYVHTPAFEFGW